MLARVAHFAPIMALESLPCHFRPNPSDKENLLVEIENKVAEYVYNCFSSLRQLPHYSLLEILPIYMFHELWKSPKLQTF